jgi:hypothetical protein
MTQFIPNLLRRTLTALGAAIALALSMPAAAQGTVTLSTGVICTYSSITVQPNGNIQVTCAGGPPVDPAVARFSITGPSTILPNTEGVVTITRTGGTDATVTTNYTFAGAGCYNGTAQLSFAAGQSINVTLTSLASGTSCVASIAPPAPHTAAPNSVSIAVQNAPPTGGPTAPVGCPAIPLSAQSRTLAMNDPPDQLRMTPGVVAYYPVIAPSEAGVSVEFTQGQQAATPAGVTTEFTVSKCPGVIDTSVPDCYYRGGFPNNNKITIYTRTVPAYGWNDQASMTGFGCLAPATDSNGAPQQWYVNVKWSYAACPSNFTYGCGFSMQWARGPW